ncbi:MAG: effector-associated domain EAD1-containing protein [Caldilineaceae bacterium]
MNSNSFIDLRTVLTTLYSDEQSIRRICSDSGVNLGAIIFGAGAINIWHSAWEETKKQNKVDALLEKVREEYPKNEELQKACENYYADLKSNQVKTAPGRQEQTNSRSRSEPSSTIQTVDESGSTKNWLMFLVAFILILAAMVFYLSGLLKVNPNVFTSEPALSCQPSQVCILVAKISPESDRSAQQFSKILYDEIYKALKVSNDPNIDIFQVAALEDPKQVEELAKKEKANLIIWGQVFRDYDKPRLKIEFKLVDQLGIAESANVRSERVEPFGYKYIDQEIECTSCEFEDIHDIAIEHAKIVAYTAVGLANYVQGDPENAYYNFEKALYCAGDASEEIAKKYEQDVKCSPQKQHEDWNPGLLWYYLGKSFILQGNYKDGIACLTIASNFNSIDPAVLIAIAEAYQQWLSQPTAPIALEYFKRAEERLNELLDSSYPPAQQISLIYDQGIIHELQEDYVSAAQHYQDAVVRLGEDNISSYISQVSLGRMQRKIQSLTKAEQTLYKASQLIKDSFWANLELARLYQDINRPNDADTMLNEAKQWSQDGSIYITQAEICQQRWHMAQESVEEDYYCAVDAYEQALKLKRFSGWLQSRVGDFYKPTDPPVRGQRWALAEEHYKEAQRLRSKDPWVHEKYAYVLLNLHKYQEAVNQYQEAVNLFYEDYVATSGFYCAFGKAQEGHGNTTEARKNYEKCQDLAVTAKEKKQADDFLQNLDRLQASQ